MTVDDDGFFLAPGEDVADLKRRIEGAVAAGGRFVEVAALDGRDISILVSGVSRIVIAVETFPPEAVAAHDAVGAAGDGSATGFDDTYDAF